MAAKLVKLFTVMSATATLSMSGNKQHQQQQQQQQQNPTRYGKGPDNGGKEFYLAFMDMGYLKGNLEILVSTSCSHDVTVYLSAPRWPSANLNKTFVVKPGGYKRIAFSGSLKMAGTENSSKAVLLVADDDIVVIAINGEDYTIGAYLALPVTGLGNEHFVVCYSPASKNCQAALVGTQNGTEVNITLSDDPDVLVRLGDGLIYHGGETFQINLDAFDTFQFQSSGDLTGTRISSSEPVSAFSGNVRTKVGEGISFDHMVEQLPPTKSWGTYFVTTPTPNRTTGDFFKIIACQANTSVTVIPLSNSFSEANQPETIVLEKSGDFAQIHIPSESYSSLRSTKPVQVFQIVLSQMSQYSDEEADPALTFIPPVQLWASNYYFVTPFLAKQDFDNFVTLVVESAHRKGILLNGIPVERLQMSWALLDNMMLAAGNLQLQTGLYHVQNVLPNVSFLCVLYGKTLSQGYGFPAGMRLLPIAQPCENTSSIKGDGLDNDCDGLVDEELCEDIVFVDDDKDNLLDEDCAKPLPINGGWSLWSEWENCCSVSPEQLLRTRSRTCNSPPSMFGGLPCSGESKEYEKRLATEGQPSPSWEFGLVTEDSGIPSEFLTHSSIFDSQENSYAGFSTEMAKGFSLKVSSSDDAELFSVTSALSFFLPSLFPASSLVSFEVSATGVTTIYEEANLISHKTVDSEYTITLEEISVKPSYNHVITMQTALSSLDFEKSSPTVLMSSSSLHGYDVPLNSLEEISPTRTVCKRCSCMSTSDTNGGLRPLNRSTEQVQTLRLDRRSLSSSLRRKTSVSDHRLSSTMLGILGVVIIVGTTMFICCLDFSTLLQDIKMTLLGQKLARKTRMGPKTKNEHETFISATSK